jgi:hypothetical protein
VVRYREADQVSLADLKLRDGERFLYTYDFTNGWEHDVCIEEVLPHEEKQSEPTWGCGSKQTFSDANS